MIERTFRRPIVRKVLEKAGIECPPRMDKDFLARLLNKGVLVPAYDSYKQAVEVVSSLEKGKVAIFTGKFRVSGGESNKGVKSLDDLVKIDSQKVLREVAGNDDVPGRLTREFLEKYRVWPYTLIKTVMSMADPENPPIGFYWIGSDNKARATTWIRAATGAELEVVKRAGDFYGKIVDKKPYGRNLRVIVGSRTGGRQYEFTLSRLPMHKRGDVHQFSDWVDVGHNSSDRDADYKGVEHEKRKHSVIFWSASAIFGFYEAMRFVKEHKEWKQFRINPFPIPTEKMDDFIDRLRLRSLIFSQDGRRIRFRSLNKTEMDKIIGAATIYWGYDSWQHWGRGDRSYLYTPQ